MARTAPILNRDTSHLLLFASSSTAAPPSRSHSHSLRFTKPAHLLLPPSLSSSFVTRVTTVPVEYAPPEFDFRLELSRLRSLSDLLAAVRTPRAKAGVIGGDSRVRRFFSSVVSEALTELDLNDGEMYLLKCLVAAGQEHLLDWGYEFAAGEREPATSSVKAAFYAIAEMIENLDVSGKSLTKTMKKKKKRIRFGLNDEDSGDLKKLLKVLGEVEQFYNCIGGVIGYQIMVMELLAQSRGEMPTIQEQMDSQFSEIHAPRGLDLNENVEYAAQAALWGIQGLPDLGEIYPLGGAADRLGLVDADTG